MGPFFTKNRSIKGLFFIQLWVCFRSVFSFFGSFLRFGSTGLVDNAQSVRLAVRGGGGAAPQV